MKRPRVIFGVAVLAAALLAIAGRPGGGQEANEDESKVPPYTLPDPLVLADGKKVTDARTWTEKRRPELLRLFETHVYGRTPAGGPKPRFQVTRTDPSALGGRATREDVAISFGEGPAARRMDLLVYLPHTPRAPVPLFLGLNFQRNDEVKWPVETIVPSPSRGTNSEPRPG